MAFKMTNRKLASNGKSSRMAALKSLASLSALDGKQVQPLPLHWAFARNSAKWLLALLLAGLAVYRVKLAPVPVISHEITPGPIAADVMGTGTLNTHFKAAVSPKVSQGRLVQVLADQNDVVTNGQLLAVLDDSEQRRQVEAAQAALSVAQAAVRRVKADEARAQAVLKLAELNYQRESELLRARISSQQDFDRAAADLQSSQSGLAVAQAAIAEAEQQQQSAEMQLGYQKQLLADTLIGAPFNGLVTKRNHDPGDVVSPGTSILEMVDTNEIWVSAWVDETAMAPLRTNQPVRVVFRSEPAKVYPGRVARLGRETDPETREFVVDVRLLELPPNWTLGQRAEVYIDTSWARNVLALSAKFLLWRKGHPGVLVDDHGWARWREVKLGLIGGDSVEITAGLMPGEQVVAPTTGKSTWDLAGRRVRGHSATCLPNALAMP
jgi:HlyD family secretion protein